MHHLEGISRSLPNPTVDIGSSKNPRAKFFLVTDPEPYCEHYDRKVAATRTALLKIFGAQSPPQDEIMKEVVELNKAERSKITKGVFLVITGEVDYKGKTEKLIPLDFCSIALDMLPRGFVSERFLSLTRRILCSFALGMNENVSRRVKEIAQVAFFTDPNTGNPCYPTYFKGSGRAHVHDRFTDESLANVQRSFIALEGNEGLAHVVSLLSRSLDSENDDLAASLMAWTALEMFVHKAYAGLKPIWDTTLRDKLPSSCEPYFKRIDDPSEGPLRLLDEFVVIASLLAPNDAASDIQRFKDQKNARDKFAHVHASMPLSVISRSLLQKYLTLFISRQKSTL